MGSTKIDEAMALAGMNPMVGMSGPHHGSFIVNVTNHDKDLEDDGKPMTTVARNLDMDDNLYGIDRFGKFFAKKKYVVMDRPDTWEKDITEVFFVKGDHSVFLESIEEELKIPYEDRPVHKPTYIYESLTGNQFLTEDQMQLDPLLEKVNLEKMSAVLSGTTGGLGRAKNLEQKGNKDAGYIPDNDFPSGTENMSSPGYLLASAIPKVTTRFSSKGNTDKFSIHSKTPNSDWKQKTQIKDTKNGHEESRVETFTSINEGILSNIMSKVDDARYSIARNANDYIRYKNAVYRISNKANCNRPYSSSLNHALMDCLRDVIPNLKGKNITDEIIISKKWYEDHKYDKFTFEMHDYRSPVKRNTLYFVNEYDGNHHMNMPISFKDLIHSFNDVKVTIQESLEEWEQRGNDIKLLREISNMHFDLDGDTIYDYLEEEMGYKRNPIVFSENDVYINFDKFVSGKEHVLLITGVSGSGKTTLGKEMAEKYNAYFVETDVYGFAVTMFKDSGINRMNFKYIDENDKMLGKYMREKNIPPDIMKDVNSLNYHSTKQKEWEERQIKYLKWLIEEQKERVVIAGGAVGTLLSKYPKYQNLPTIFKGTSLMKSIYRRVFIRSKRPLIHHIKGFYKTMKSYGVMMDEVNRSRKNVMTNNEWEYVKEKKRKSSLEEGFFNSLGILNEAKLDTQTYIPFKCELKYCHNWIDNGVIKPTKKPNPMLILHKDNKQWRVRSEILLFKDDKVFLCKEDKVNQYGNKYKLPGGGIDDPKESIEFGAARECEEEALMIPKNVRYTGVCIQKIYEKTPWWHPMILHPEGIKYDGSISFVCTGIYNKDFNGYVAKMHRDNTKNGHFYSWDEVKDLLSKEHKKIFRDYLDQQKINN